MALTSKQRFRMHSLRRAVIRLLWRAVADQDGCVCEEGEPRPTDLCMAWRALGYGEHFDWRTAQNRLPTRW